MPKLNQICALVKDRKADVEKALTNDYNKKLTQSEAFVGMIRDYKPSIENGDKLPREEQKIQFTVDNILDSARKKLTELWDLVLTQDTANCQANADIMIDNIKLASAVPVTTLLFMEKQLHNLMAMVQRCPTPNPAETWHFDDTLGTFSSAPTESARMVKTHHVVEKFKPTEHQPGQADIIYLDKQVGTWTKKMFSSAMSADKKFAMIARLQKVLDAVKLAREEANMTNAKSVKIGDLIFDFAFDNKNQPTQKAA